ncbi:hypothetical protein LAZ67_3003056 [Cordylochernes scorpioides]|uniref:RNA-directed DNA polymerase n=1 Tax=Cordylochernes scorpioides TaxID=51811 RepID=A0ABY6K8V2_9ARAC|nr:hypothetical protein LAZ67_3003056 [Cordylochernes scorpioides]
MLQFSFHIFHTPVKDLITADALSRQPLPGHLPEDEKLQEEVEHFVRNIVLHQSTTDDRLAKIALNQKLEPTLQNVVFYSKNERSFYDVRDEIGEENGLQMRGLRVIIPSNMRKDVLNRIHAGHQGITKCRARTKDNVQWPGIGQEIQDIDWPRWKQRFSRYRLLSNLNAKEQEYQITALIYHMGERAEEIHSAFKLSADDAKNLDKIIEAFDNHFIGKRNVVYEWALFGLRSQRPEETINEFVTVLHRISEHCEYANLREEIIRDRIVLGVKDRKLEEELMLNENLTLAKAVENARQWEAVDTTRKVAKQKPKTSGHGKDNGRLTPRQTDSAKEIDEGIKIPTCGTTKHHYRYRDKCPVKDKVCGKCAKKGHYINLRRRKINEVNATSSEETSAREKVSFVYAVRTVIRWKAERAVRVNGSEIHFKLDPGSDVTLIPFSLYKRYFSNV